MATGTFAQPIADPRVSFQVDGPALSPETSIKQRVWGLKARVDPSVTFEEYQYWAAIERAEEHEANRIYAKSRGHMSFTRLIKDRFSKGVHHDNAQKAAREQALQTVAEHSASSNNASDNEKKTDGREPSPSVGGEAMAVTDEEWKTAARALRTASWGTIFYLITTDILGWSTTA